MHYVNKLFNKKVIGLTSGEQIASVRDVVLDAEVTRIVALVVAGGRAKHDEVVRWESVTGVGEYLVVDDGRPFAAASDDDEVRALREGAAKITGKRIISATGEKLGEVGDIVFDAGGAILGFELKRQGLFGGGDAPLLRVEDVQAVGKDAVIATTTELAPPASAAAAEPVAGDELAAGGPAPAEERPAGEGALAADDPGRDDGRPRPLPTG